MTVGFGSPSAQETYISHDIGGGCPDKGNTPERDNLMWDAIKLHESVDMVPSNMYLDLWYTHGVTIIFLTISSFHLYQFIDSAY